MKNFKLLIILLLTVFLFIGCKSEDSDEATDTTAPTISTKTLSFSNLSSTALKVSWSDASDDSTSDVSTLSYRIYKSNSSNIDTVSNIEANGTAIGDFAKGVTYSNITGLSPENSYYFNVIVKDNTGNKSTYTLNSTKTNRLPVSTKLASSTSFPTGNYVDDGKGTHSITAGYWFNGKSYYRITKIDTTSNASFMVAQNGITNANNPSKYSRFDWHKVGTDLYYCQITSDQDDANTAGEVDTASRTNPASNGCGSSAWSKLTAFNDVIGDFVDNSTYTHTISANQWINGNSTFSLIKNDIDNKFIIAQNSANNALSASKYSRFDWHKDGTDLYYCQIAYNKDSADDAEAVTKPTFTNAVAANCGTSPWSKLSPIPDIIGNFATSYSPYSISATKWIAGPDQFNVTKYNSTNQYFIAQNGANNAWSASKYSRFDWHKDGTDLYYCQIAYNKDTAADAEAVSNPTFTNATATNCGVGQWTKLSTISDIIGDFSETAGTYKSQHSVSATQWLNGKSSYTLIKGNATGKYFIGLNNADNAWNASKYSRFDWAKSGTDLYYCQSAYNKATAAEAEAVTTSDSSDPANSGCGGFPWTKLTP